MFELEPGQWINVDYVVALDFNKGTVDLVDNNYVEVPVDTLVSLLNFMKKTRPSLSIAGQEVEQAEKKMNYQA